MHLSDGTYYSHWLLLFLTQHCIASGLTEKQNALSQLFSTLSYLEQSIKSVTKDTAILANLWEYA
jgi:hypothetical protein